MDGREIKELRHRLGLSTAEMGRCLHFAPANAANTVRNMEAGRIPISGPAKALYRVMAILASPSPDHEKLRAIKETINGAGA